MGLKYVLFRIWHALLKRSGILKSRFPIEPQPEKMFTLEEWQRSESKFFFSSRHDIDKISDKDSYLRSQASDILRGRIMFFNGIQLDLGLNYDWLTNPENNFRYKDGIHWSEIQDYSTANGDIKYVWEKSRFCYLYTLIRNDHHFGDDHSEFVFSEILSWIDSNPINTGPNYVCSQEISIRVLNWIFALHFYKYSTSLTNVAFDKIIHNINWQIKHVYRNILFSRIAVRNNHAITETLTLYVVGLLFPKFLDSEKWVVKGKHWFEKEIAYQIYPDGTFLQFSMNYHRVVIQLLTWAIRLSDLNKQSLDPIVLQRSMKSYEFLNACMDGQTGHLPNYGANDGSIFFRLNGCEFRNFKPQVETLGKLINVSKDDGQYEDLVWLGIEQNRQTLINEHGALQFNHGGYYILKQSKSLTFIRCGTHKDRPSQADNLHIDIHVNGLNVLGDGGSYKYNSDDSNLKYFFGTRSHNTVMLGDNDQMLKGKRFMWFYWSQAVRAEWLETTDYFEFEGKIRAFRHIDRRATHHRKIRKIKSINRWEIVDFVEHNTDMPIHQIWNITEPGDLKILIKAADENGTEIALKQQRGWFSSEYGLKKPCTQLVFSSFGKTIRTIIEI